MTKILANNINYSANDNWVLWSKSGGLSSLGRYMDIKLSQPSTFHWFRQQEKLSQGLSMTKKDK